MAQAAGRAEVDVAAAGAGQIAVGPIDRGHLLHMTFGDRSLQRELLQLFIRQAEMLLGRMRDSDAATMAALAHTVKGSARGIGAWGVARAAEACERAAGGSSVERDLAMADLSAALAEARPAIAELLKAG